MAFLRFLYLLLYFLLQLFLLRHRPIKNGQPSNVPNYIKQLGFSRLLLINYGKKMRKRGLFTLQSQRTILLSIKLSVTGKLSRYVLHPPRTYYLYTPCVPCLGRVTLTVKQTVKQIVPIDMNTDLPKLPILRYLSCQWYICKEFGYILLRLCL